MNKKIILTAGEFDEIMGKRELPDYADYKDVAILYYDALMDWAYRNGRDDVIASCPDAYNCPRSFQEFWYNTLYVEGQDD